NSRTFARVCSVPIQVKCPACGKGLKAPDAAAGKKAKCPACGGMMQVPALKPQLEDDLGLANFPEDGDLLGMRAGAPSPPSKPVAKPNVAGKSPPPKQPVPAKPAPKEEA